MNILNLNLTLLNEIDSGSPKGEEIIDAIKGRQYILAATQDDLYNLLEEIMRLREELWEFRMDSYDD